MYSLPLLFFFFLRKVCIAYQWLPYPTFPEAQPFFFFFWSLHHMRPESFWPTGWLAQPLGAGRQSHATPLLTAAIKTKTLPKNLRNPRLPSPSLRSQIRRTPPHRPPQWRASVPPAPAPPTRTPTNPSRCVRAWARSAGLLGERNNFQGSIWPGGVSVVCHRWLRRPGTRCPASASAPRRTTSLPPHGTTRWGRRRRCQKKPVYAEIYLLFTSYYKCNDAVGLFGAGTWAQVRCWEVLPGGACQAKASISYDQPVLSSLHLLILADYESGGLSSGSSVDCWTSLTCLHYAMMWPTGFFFFLAGAVLGLEGWWDDCFLRRLW